MEETITEPEAQPQAEPAPEAKPKAKKAKPKLVKIKKPKIERPTANWLQQDKARMLAAQIAGYWLTRGYRIAIRLVGSRRLNSKGEPSAWFIRSDMINGLPRI